MSGGFDTISENLRLQQIYDLAVETGNAGYWDVALWPARLGTMVKPFDRSRLEPA